MELNCRAIKNVLIYFKKKHGYEALQAFAQKTGVPLKYLEDENNWISFTYWKKILQDLVEYEKNPDAPFEAGLQAATKEAFGGLLYFFARFGSPTSMYRLISQFTPTFAKVAEIKILELKKNSAKIQTKHYPHFTQDINNCRNVQGQLASIPTLWNLPPAKVSETTCQTRGDDSCTYELYWINLATQKFGLFGLFGGLITAGAFEFAIPESQIFLFLTLPLIGYFAGHCLDFKRTQKENLRISHGQSEGFLKALKDLEKLNEELQQRIEERTNQLRQSNQELALAYENLKAQEMQLIQAEKMAGLGRLVAGIAHELNTPSAMIQSAANYNVTHSGEILRHLTDVQKILKETEEQIAFLAIVENLIKGSLALKKSMSLKEEEALALQIEESFKALGIPEAKKASRILAEFGTGKELKRLGQLLKKHPQKELMKCLQSISRYFSNIKAIELATLKIAKLVKALRVYSRADQAKRDEMDIHQEIEVCLTILKGQITDGIKIRKEFGSLPKFFGIADELNQVWTNLILNAIQALNGKGEIMIETSYKNDRLYVKITDSGPGIASEILVKIFDPFFTTKPPGEGSGLGLGICQQIIHKHQGEIKVESRPGKTCFEIILPVKQENKN